MKKILPALLASGVVFGPLAFLTVLGGIAGDGSLTGAATTDEACGQGPGPGGGQVLLPLAEGTYVPTSPYGMRVNPVTGVWRLHAGTDYGASAGTKIYAIAGGKVTHAGPAGGYGNLIVIEHNFDDERVESAYAHMYDDGIHVTRGDSVVAGQHIGDVGSAGNSTGPHLHFEIRILLQAGGQVSTDSAAWLKARNATHPDPAGAQPGPDCDLTGQVPPAAPGQLPGKPPPYAGADRMVKDPSGTSGQVTAATAYLWNTTTGAFPGLTGHCYRPDPGGGEHPVGRACDISPGNAIGTYPTAQQKALGWDVAHWLRMYAAELKVSYVIWQGRIWSTQRADQGWRTYYWKGSIPKDVTTSHRDHVHVSLDES